MPRPQQFRLAVFGTARRAVTLKIIAMIATRHRTPARRAADCIIFLRQVGVMGHRNPERVFEHPGPR